MVLTAAPRPRRYVRWAVAFSLVIHTALLLAPLHSPIHKGGDGRRLSTRLAPKPPPKPEPEAIETPPPPPAPTTARAPLARKRVLTREGPAAAAIAEPPKFSKAEREEMNNFLDSLEEEAKARPSLAQRSLAMAREIGREATSPQRESDIVSIERIPDSPEINPFSLEMYLDSLVNKLNRSTSFVKRPQRAGVRVAAVQLRINPDGTVKSLEVLNEADQQDEIDFIKRLIERAAPYSPFPADMFRSAKSMAILICIRPSQGGGMGFSRTSGGRGC